MTQETDVQETRGRHIRQWLSCIDSRARESRPSWISLPYPPLRTASATVTWWNITASLDSGGSIEFLIPGSGDDYMDLANTMLHVQAKVTRTNGHVLDAAEPVGQLAAFAVQPGRRLPERHARDLFVQHVRVSVLHRDAAELRT